VSRAARQELRDEEEGTCEADREESTDEAIGIQRNKRTEMDKG